MLFRGESWVKRDHGSRYHRFMRWKTSETRGRSGRVDERASPAERPQFRRLIHPINFNPASQGRRSGPSGRMVVRRRLRIVDLLRGRVGRGRQAEIIACILESRARSPGSLQKPAAVEWSGLLSEGYECRIFLRPAPEAAFGTAVRRRLWRRPWRIGLSPR